MSFNISYYLVNIKIYNALKSLECLDDVMAAIKRKTLTAEHYSRFKLSIFNFQLVIAVFLYLPNPQILAFFVLKAQIRLKNQRKKRPLFDILSILTF
ncbi:hypothetical protein AGMMS49574_19930 [Bacteroidia bacterium]|nr:hypothetical protein AGMMS49574_19930 [Bacteroidia bacterium]